MRQASLSRVIQKILKTKEEFSPSVNMSESFLHPSNIQYPFLPSGNLYRLTGIADAIANNKQYALNQRGLEPVLVEELLFFDSYFSISPPTLEELFHCEKLEERVEEQLLASMANDVYTKKFMPKFEKAINPHAIAYQEDLQKETTEARRCLVLFRTLRNKISNPTYQNFRQELDKFSIFCGRNPMVSIVYEALMSILLQSQ